MAPSRREQLRSIKKFPSLVKYLRDELDWPIESDDFEALTFEFTPEELGIDKKNAAKIEQIKRLRPLSASQPWGIFFVKFDRKKLPVVALRRLLNAVALKKRASANKADQAAWHSDDLLFISNYGEEEDRTISFAHFSQNEQKQDLPVLKVLGWDDKDTALHLDDVADTLEANLTWDEAYGKDPDQWREHWRAAFTVAHGEVVRTSKDMAIRLAGLARKIRIRIGEVLAIESDKGPVRQLMAAFQEALIDDLDEDGFADMYAQTISYGLLSARVTNPSGESADDLASAMPITNPFLKELMEQFLQVGGRKRGRKKGTGIDFDELGVSEVIALLDAANMEAVLKDFGDRNPQEDPVIHFFEGFLQEYDSQIRKDRGVFYTPRPVVSFIVRSVDELLRTEFGLEDGLADTTTWGEMAGRIDDLEIPEGATADQAFVQILDPATGTGTFLVEVIDLIRKTMKDKWEAEGHREKKTEKLWNDYVPEHLLPRLHGYELMMAPYAIAHMKIGLKLYETGYRFESDERARVYLTNALEPAQNFSGTLSFAIPALAHEAEAANAIKRDQRFTVVIGNPPYSGYSSNMNPWIDGLLHGIDPNGLQAHSYYEIDGHPIAERKLWLQDDYVKFIRLSHWNIEKSGVGVHGMITNHSFLDSPTCRGMRHAITRSFQLICAINLHGSTKRQESAPQGGRDENVFDIQAGVSISLLVKTGKSEASRVTGIDLWGDRASKLKWLATQSLLTAKLDQIFLRSPYYLFAIRDLSASDEYDSAVPLPSAMPFFATGIQTSRDAFAVDSDRQRLVSRLTRFFDTKISDVEMFSEFGIADLSFWKPSLIRRKDLLRDVLESIDHVSFRAFDTRWIAAHEAIVHRLRAGAMRCLASDRIGLLVSRQQSTAGFTHVFAVDSAVDMFCISNKSREGQSVFPLFKDKDPDLLDQLGGWTPNFSDDFLRRLQCPADQPEAALNYIYAQLHSSTFRSRYSELLKMEFPRIFIPRAHDLFRNLGRLGGELIDFHLMRSTELKSSTTTLVGSGDFQVEKVSYSDETVWLDKAKTRGFKGVPKEVWNFHIGAYQVCEKWLKDRQAKGGKNPRPGRVLTDEDIEHYQKIVVALSESIRIMAEIDEVIEAHGDWPGAFQTGEASEIPEDHSLAAESAPAYGEE